MLTAYGVLLAAADFSARLKEEQRRRPGGGKDRDLSSGPFNLLPCSLCSPVPQLIMITDDMARQVAALLAVERVHSLSTTRT